MSYYENDGETGHWFQNLFVFLAVALLFVYVWNSLVWLFFRHLGWGYVPVNGWTPFLGWVMAVAFVAPFAVSYFPLYHGASMSEHPNAYLWSLLTYPVMICLLRLFPQTEA